MSSKDRAQALEWIDKAEALLTEAGDSHGTELSHMGFWAGLLIGHPLAPFLGATCALASRNRHNCRAG